MRKIILFLILLSIILPAQIRQDQVRNLPDSLHKKADTNYVTGITNGKANSIHAHSQYLLYTDTLDLFYETFAIIEDTLRSHNNRINTTNLKLSDSVIYVSHYTLDTMRSNLYNLIGEIAEDVDTAYLMHTINRN